MQGTMLRTLGVVAALTMSAAACGSDADSGDGDGDSTVATAPSESSGTTADPTEDSTSASVTETTPVTTAEPSDGSGDSDGAVVTSAGELADGPVTLIAIGDSLTAGEGDESGQGYVGLLGDAISATPGREDVSVVNLGASGWDSTMAISGTDGASGGQLTPALDAVTEAVTAGRAALVTVLLGSNDMWYLYEYGPPDGTGPAEEAATEELYRSNLEQIVSELIGAGAVVVMALPDDQTIRPAVVDIDRLQAFLPSITQDEVAQMRDMAGRLDAVAADIAAKYGLLTVDTNAEFWGDPAKLADDGIHPNQAGYADFAELWIPVVQQLL